MEFEDSVDTYLFNNCYWFFWKPSENEVRKDYCFELYSLRVSDKKIFKVTNRNFFFDVDFIWQINTINNQLFILTTFNLEVDKRGQIGLLLIDQDMLKEGKYIPIRDSCGLESVKLEGDKILIDVQPYKRSFNFFSLFNFLFERYQVKKWNSEPYGNKWRYILNSNFEIIDSFEITNNK
ncbi:MAG: hypothetical protein IPM56_08560 [Ignavibacteriales bacterium]|nr:MAG: hypothetical protein IPM56_08560 [Ignavibacteriales bacterium]